MRKQILNTKRKLSKDKDSEENQEEYNTFKSNFCISNIIFKKKEKKARKRNGNDSNSSGNLRIISALKGEKAIILSTENISEFYDFIDCFNCLYYIKNQKRHYLIHPEIIEQFYRRTDYQILYDLDFCTQNNEEMFKWIHISAKRKEIETITEFCPFPKWYFKTNDHKYFHTPLSSPNSILKFNRLNDKNFGKRMNPKFSKCSNSRITKFYGPLGTGKSTLVYLFFRAITFVPGLIDSDGSYGNGENTNNMSFEDLISSKKLKIKIKENQSIFNDNIEVDVGLKSLNLDEDSFKDENTIDLEEIEENEIPEKKASIENTIIEHIISPLYEKEYENNDSTEEEFNFLSSFYINLDRERTTKDSKENQIYFEFELMQLFRTYKFYQYIISYINSNKKINIFDRIKQIADFMKIIKNERNYFIIIDHISENDHKDIIDLENYLLKDPYCYIIELPRIKTFQEKNNFLKDYYLNEEERLECYDDKDEITFIKRGKKYGIIYSTDFYKPIFNGNKDKDELIFQENFGKNIFYYCLWKYGDKEKKHEIKKFIDQQIDVLCEYFKANYNNDEDTLSFNIKTILNIIEEKKEIKNKDFIAHLPLDYFVLIYKDNKCFLNYSFPLIDKVIKKLNVSSSIELIKSRNFINYFDNFLKGGIMEKVFAEKMEKNYLEILNNNLISINIDRIVDNNIRDYYTYEEENNFLNKNKIFNKIKQENKNITFKNILFNQAQNSRHYDLGIKLFNQGNIYGFFQVTFHKSWEDIMELINNLWIDLNYGINKIENLCDEKGEIINGIYVFFVLMDLKSYNILNMTEKEKKIIDENSKYNKKIINKLIQYNIDYVFLDSKGNITKDGKIIKEISFKLNLIGEFSQEIKNLSSQKSKIEKEYKLYFKQLYKKDIKILYFNPIIQRKLNDNRILVNLFKDKNYNYYEINQKGEIHYYDKNGNEINKHVADEIEKNNKKNWKMNVYLKID